MTKLDRRALFASGAAAALLAATGVSAAPTRGGCLKAALSGASRADRWDVSGQGVFMQAAQQGAVFDTLTELAADGTLRGELAVGWHTPDAGLTWDFDLRPGVMFHDCTPLHVDDVIASLAFQTIALAPNRLRISLDVADTSLPLKLAEPAHLIRPADAARAQAGIGTGLYRVETFEAGRRFVGVRVDNHWKDGSSGWFDRVEFHHFADADVRREALHMGLVDVADVDGIAAASTAFQLLPSESDVQMVANRSLVLPTVVGTHAPLDNLRMAERWWAV
ncbi:MAG: peptide ABC transporter substrate-binding protein [Rhodobacteraceae bacterium]|nr:peptide ABC transporter substrate-binding protein [Paracoccaceae bacterium]